MSVRFHLFMFDVNRVNEDFECKKVGSKCFSVAPGMEIFSLDLRELLKKVSLVVRCESVYNLQSQSDLR